MESLTKKIFEGKDLGEARRHFLKFGRGNYRRRFLISLNKGTKIKIRASYEFANEFVNFVRENKEIKFSGKILTTEKIPGKIGRKKMGCFIYEVSEISLEEFENPYYYLLDANADDIILKIKKTLPKLGKSVNKIDNKFCSMDLDKKYWNKIKEDFFWDVPDNAKKVSIEHEIIIDDIIIPEGLDNPNEIREKARRKGKILRKLTIDGKEEVKEKSFII